MKNYAVKKNEFEKVLMQLPSGNRFKFFFFLHRNKFSKKRLTNNNFYSPELEYYYFFSIILVSCFCTYGELG